jgi:uncharacterized protein (DUF1330 family)
MSHLTGSWAGGAGGGLVIVSGQLCRILVPRQVPRLQCYNAPILPDAAEEPAMAVDLLNIDGLEDMEHQGPIVMVNLMRFHDRSLDGDGTGWDAYLRYSALTVPMIKARGGTLLWTGDAKAVALGRQDGNQWDYLALVYYPSVAAFIDMMSSADYESKCDPHRRNGCAEHVIICTRESYSKFKVG